MKIDRISGSSHPLVELDIELVEGDVSRGHENVLDEGVDPLEDCEVEELGALLIEIGHQFPVLCHLLRGETQ